MITLLAIIIGAALFLALVAVFYRLLLPIFAALLVLFVLSSVGAVAYGYVRAKVEQVNGR